MCFATCWLVFGISLAGGPEHEQELRKAKDIALKEMMDREVFGSNGGCGYRSGL